MSKKSFFKGFGKKPKKQEPRPFAEIQQQYMELRGLAGELQYKIHVTKQDLDKVNQALISINNEAAVRQQLDKENAPAAQETKSANAEGSAQ